MSRAPFNILPPGVSATDPDADAEAAYLDAVDIKIAGGSNLYIGDALDPDNTIWYFGEQLDDTPLVWREFFNDVPGDSHGGPQGPPIGRQQLGRVAQASFNLSAWNHTTRYWLERNNEAYSTNGVILDYEIGEELLSLHAIRLLIVPARDNRKLALPTDKSDDFFCYNFPACMISSPIECGQGTKFSSLRFTIEAHRAPPQFTKRGIIWDRDIAGLAAAQAAAQAAQQTAWANLMAARAANNQAAGE